MKSFLRRALPVLAFLGLASCTSSAPAHARELKVSRTEAGAYKSIQAAVNAAQPGDTILLSPQDSPYYESASFRDKSGTPEKPIILDGQGATLDGSEPLRADEWQEVEPGLFRSTAFPERMRMSNSVLGRYYFITGGAMNRMGRTSKGKRAAFKALADLQPAEWTYLEAEKAFYIRLQLGQAISTVRAPERSSGVALSGNCENIEIRDITATHVWNDGFNIHGRSRDLRFKDIRAIECGDDGISAHGDCHIEVDGFVSQRNSTGLCHVNQSRSVTRNFVLEDNAGYGIYLLDDSQHTLQNGIVRSKSGYALRLTNKTAVDAENILFSNEGGEQTGLVVEGGAVLKAARLGIWNLPVSFTDSTVELRNSAIATDKPVQIAANVNWQASDNLWDVPAIKWKDTEYAPANFAAYQQASGQDANSRVEKITKEKLFNGAFASPGLGPNEPSPNKP